MTIAARTPSLPHTVDGTVPSVPAVPKSVAAPVARPETTDESYRIAASLAHRPGS